MRALIPKRAVFNREIQQQNGQGMMVEVMLFNTPHVQGDTTVDWTGYDGGSNII